MIPQKPKTLMEYVNLGNTGMKVSRLCLGCMSFGSSSWQRWVKDEEESLELIGKAFDTGINFFDTADVYSNGESERVLGKAIKKFNMPRSRIVVATKVFYIANDDYPCPELCPELETRHLHVNGIGLSRKHIFDAVDASLQRLDLDYVDLYQIHRFDNNTPIEETMEALNDLVRLGKVRYIGASTGQTWEFQKANNIAEKRGWAKFVSMQNLQNLIYREEDREMNPYCLDSGIATLPYSILANGILTGKNRRTERKETDVYTSTFYSSTTSDDAIVDRVLEVSKKHNCSAAQVAIAWLLTKPHVTAPIIGCTSESQIMDAVGSLQVKLTQKDIDYLEELYLPHKVSGIMPRPIKTRNYLN
ncbi:NADP-dependent oxidoreductase domain-containing protein [Sporodiniella umbellata]|nr:NADP-dependent oxidoreductase domain-containing protein [Sporodiniella umbellata]